MTTQVQRDDWGESLVKCLGYFLGEENYEWCDTIKKLKKDIGNGDTETD